MNVDTRIDHAPTRRPSVRSHPRGEGEPRPPTRASGQPTAMYARTTEPTSDALTRRRVVISAQSVAQPPLVEAARVTPAPELSPRAASELVQLAAPCAPCARFDEPGETVFLTRSRSRASHYLRTRTVMSVPTRIAMIVSALLVIAALCLLSVMAA
ncbi:MAG: hypothetical protein ABW252_25045 [Polyangiales bacterium]